MSCFNCKYRDIQETSHEWIECRCELDNKWHNPFEGCENNEDDNDE